MCQWQNSLLHGAIAIETPWLKEAPCHPLQHALKDLGKAYKNFFAKRAAFPASKRKAIAQVFVIQILNKSNSIK